MPEPRDKLEALFAEALDLAPQEREAYVLQAAEGDESLSREVLSLLSHHQASSGFLELPLSRGEGGAWTLRPAAGPALKPGEVIGPYRIVAPIGSGGMADVYAAEQTAPMTRRVAVKLLRFGVDSREMVARLEQERQTLALMSHPGIASVYDAGMSGDGRPWFVMELVEGRPITEFCDGGGLPIDERLKLFRRVCDAVQHAHQRGVIHRDLKPSNILVVADGEPAPRIIDFGIAKVLQDPLNDAVRTEMGMCLGTPGYMSPEQLDRSGAAVDTRSDVYALGVVLHELLAGSRPSGRSDPPRGVAAAGYHDSPSGMPRAPSQIVAASPVSEEVVAHRATSRRALVAALAGDLDAIVLKALEDDPERRYASAADLSADVLRHLRREPVLARRPTLGYRLLRTVDRNRVLCGVLATLAAVLTVGLGVSTWLFVEHRRQSEDLFRLSDGVVLSDVSTAAEALRPAIPAKVRDFERWLAGPARGLIDRLPMHRAKLQQIVGRADAVEATGPLFEDEQLEFQYRLLRQLVERLAAFAQPEIGLYDRTRARLHFARAVGQRSIEAHGEAWQDAIRSIADPTECPLYRGLRIEPQLGLVPIGRDPRSGLWEFAHLETGTIAEPDKTTGRLTLAPEAGLVLVLIPPGKFVMGEDAPQSGAGSRQPRTPNNSPAHTVTLGEPFFLSKFEMTRAQWIRVTGADIRASGEEVNFGGGAPSPIHPVAGVTWDEANEVVGYLGLVLPTEAQWEYAARAGTTTAWWTGDDLDDLRSIANVADLSYQAVQQAHSSRVVSWNDGFPGTAPVGSFEPNPFGLHDVAGNLEEWVRDGYGRYDVVPRPSDGLRRGPGEMKVYRGGNYEANRLDAAHRTMIRGGKRQGLGVRPARRLDGAHEPGS